MNNYIKSPLNYVGNKGKLLEQIIPLFPDNINTFYDIFGGGFTVGINVYGGGYRYNDIDEHIVNLFKYLYENNTNCCLEQIDKLINDFDLSKTNNDGFNKLRDYYNNENNSPIVFYTMICYAFNYQIRFNKQGKYNMPFGKNRSSFNPVLRNKFISFCDSLHNKKIEFSNLSFDKIDYDNLQENDFLYFDPPYLNSVAAYNENGGWTEDNEKQLLQLLDNLSDKNIKWALSNNLKYNNEPLENWMTKYNVHYLNADYNNCNYHKIDKSKDIEVLITNY